MTFIMKLHTLTKLGEVDFLPKIWKIEGRER